MLKFVGNWVRGNLGQVRCSRLQGRKMWFPGFLDLSDPKLNFTSCDIMEWPLMGKTTMKCSMHEAQVNTGAFPIALEKGKGYFPISVHDKILLRCSRFEVDISLLYILQIHPGFTRLPLQIYLRTPRLPEMRLVMQETPDRIISLLFMTILVQEEAVRI